MKCTYKYIILDLLLIKDFQFDMHEATDSFDSILSLEAMSDKTFIIVKSKLPYLSRV